MATFIDRLNGMFEKLQKSPRDVPTYVMVPHDHVDTAGSLAPQLETDQHYFDISIKEMYLSNQREWFSEFDPMVCTVAEFGYAGEGRAVPFVVGPSLVQQHGQQVPEGRMVYTNTRVAGPYPYRGEGLTVTIILYGLQTKNYPRELLKFVEGAAGILDFSVASSSYLKLADLVLDGVEALTGTTQQAKPVLGIRQHFSPAKPGYYALIAADGIDENSLWVKENKLYQGASVSDAKPFRRSDYVLYSVISTEPNDIDVSRLPFYKSWKMVLQEANKASTSEIKESAKVNLSALLADIYTSDDLTEPHKQALADKYISTATALIRAAEGRASLGEKAQAEEPSMLDGARSKALAVLKL